MVYLDTNILIYLFENHTDYAHTVASFIADCQNTNIPLVTSSITVTELIAGNEHISLKIIGQLHGLQIIDVSKEIAEYAGNLQVKHKMNIGDAIHLATAYAIGCNKIYTNDTHLGKSAANIGMLVIKP